MRLFELFDKTAEWQWNGEMGIGNADVATFIVGNIPYYIQFDKETYDAEYLGELFEIENEYATICDVLFSMSYGSAPEGKRGIDITGTGNAFEVFATVMEIIQWYVKENPDVNYLHFEASENSRIKLYDRFVSQYPGRSEQAIQYPEDPGGESQLHYLLKV